MRLLLDTSGYSAFKRGQTEVVELLRAATFIAFNAIVLGELLSGFAAGSREERNRRELRELLSADRVHLLTMGSETAERFALIHRQLRQAGTPIPTHDLWIAASAMEHGLRVVTTDGHFRLVPMLPVEYVAVQ
ncbi:MAG TPA: type II toxin-antitoxin system VapC family toxin [Chloroflexota bacterium]|jgi:tRNA(fMet)-specific endonuclease VapC|nr:type II toxin-antitoxin system VapC family toxin [Chloroflexota bacterium]